MKEKVNKKVNKNRFYIENLKMEEVPWGRLTTAHGRADNFPECFNIIEKMKDRYDVKCALYEITSNIEHQSTLWQATPFAMIFLARIFKCSLAEIKENKTALFLAEQMLNFFRVIAECFHDTEEEEYEGPLPLFSDMLKEEYLWPEEYSEEEEEIRYEEGPFPDDLLYSFWYYSYQVLLCYKPLLENIECPDIREKVEELLKLL